MASTSETGHTKNVANFEILVSSILAYGQSYNPSKDIITIESIQNQLNTAKVLINAHNDANSALTIAIDEREIAFKPVSKYVTRIYNALKASSSSDHNDESVKTIIRKLQGKRAGSKISDSEKKVLEAEGKEVNQISVSQLSYDTRLDNFDVFISLLSTIPEYNPNEEDLKVEALKTFNAQLRTKNSNVIKARVHTQNTRDARNEILYKPIVGLVQIASDIKSYVKSVWGVNSNQYKQISNLNFRIQKN